MALQAILYASPAHEKNWHGLRDALISSLKAPTIASTETLKGRSLAGVLVEDVTRILMAIEGGDSQGSDDLLPLVYDQLRLLAAKKLSHESPGQTLQATALVHEAYVRLVGDDPQGWDNRGHFFAAAAEAMRRILVENARRKKSQKRGGGHERVNLEELTLSITGPNEDIIAVSEALDKLAVADPAAAELVKLHYFSGLTIDQAAQLSGIARRTAVKYLAYARAWLHREITKGDEPSSQGGSNQ